ncbi:MAG: hypothetical protein WCP98_17920, partial [Actinomycetes bacterium]
MKARDDTDRTERPRNQGKSIGKRTRIVIILCAVVVLAAGATAALAVLKQRPRDAEQVKRQAAALASQKKAAEKLASEFDSVATDYTDMVGEIESALAENATAVNAWKEESAERQAAYEKRMAAYGTKVAVVNAYNSSRWVPNARTTYYEASRPGFLLYEEPRIPSGNVEYIDGFECDGVYVDKILTWRASRPKGPRHKLPRRPPRPKAPSKIQDPVRDQWLPLAGLKTRLATLTVELDSAKLDPQFLPVADAIRNGIELLRTDIDLTHNACSTAVRRDRRIGYVAVCKKLKGADVTGVGEAVQAVQA